jgi:SEC-C motif
VLHTGRPVRTEQEIFDGLANLCTSPGYVHAIAFFCFRDTIVRYQDEMTVEDMRNLYSPERLVRTEISTLIGLMIKAKPDYALPKHEITDRYISRTQELLEEMHRVMMQGMFGGLDLKAVLDSGVDPFDRGAALREPIFYSGETAYSYQYRALSVRKYETDDGWLQSNKGFSINVAKDVVDALERLRTEKLTAIMNEIIRARPDNWTLLPGFSFTIDELTRYSGIDALTVEKVVEAFAVSRGEDNHAFQALNDFNVVNATPLLRLDDGTFVHFQEYSLSEALYDSPFYWMLGDPLYRSVAMLHRGRFTEQFSKERLEHVFGKKHVYGNVDIYESKGKKVGEIDALVVFGDRAIVLQAKSKKLTLEARRGNDNQINEDFKKSVQDSYDQGRACALLIENRKLKFVDGSGQELKFSENFKTIDILCVVSNNYPALSFQARQFLKIQTSEVIQPPFVMDIFTLDVMTEMLDSPLYFLSYINRRAVYSDKVMASHELVILSQHLKRNLWVEEQYNFVLFEDDIGADLDVAMSVRRDRVPGKRTPDGILTRIANTALGRLLKQIEAQPVPPMIDLGFVLLTLSENAVVGISDALETTAGKARRDGQNHDISVPLVEANEGLTIHCNDDPISVAGPRLEGHCTLRKYAQKANDWYGICVRPTDISLRFGVSLHSKWEPDGQMEVLASRLRKPTRFGRKIGRNEPCPCGSDKKYKKCCGK